MAWLRSYHPALALSVVTKFTHHNMFRVISSSIVFVYQVLAFLKLRLPYNASWLSPFQASLAMVVVTTSTHHSIVKVISSSIVLFGQKLTFFQLRISYSKQAVANVVKTFLTLLRCYRHNLSQNHREIRCQWCKLCLKSLIVLATGLAHCRAVLA